MVVWGSPLAPGTLSLNRASIPAVTGSLSANVQRKGLLKVEKNSQALKKDPGETLTLENSEPLVLADLLAEYENYVRDNGVLPVPADYQQIKQAARNGLNKRYLNPIKAFAVSYGWMIVVALIAIIVLIRRKRQSGPV